MDTFLNEGYSEKKARRLFFFLDLIFVLLVWYLCANDIFLVLVPALIFSPLLIISNIYYLNKALVSLCYLVVSCGTCFLLVAPKHDQIIGFLEAWQFKFSFTLTLYLLSPILFSVVYGLLEYKRISNLENIKLAGRTISILNQKIRENFNLFKDIYSLNKSFKRKVIRDHKVQTMGKITNSLLIGINWKIASLTLLGDVITQEILRNKAIPKSKDT